MAHQRFALAVHTLVLLARTPTSSTSAALAGSTNVHATCVRRLLSPFVRAGIVEAVEGRDGGYRLARPAAEITLADIYDITVSAPVRHSSEQLDQGCPISRAMGLALADISADAESRFREALAGRTLAEVAAQIDSRVNQVLPAVG
ncbi:MAG: Rrf2 family transcriptional regulator [Thermomicrobiales bacterium]|nr:Rrf2 family transcriptional regulator [Thermomicrobiales bacterium]